MTEQLAQAVFPVFPGMSPLQIEYFKWQRKRAGLVKLISFRKVPVISDQVEDYVDQFTVQKKDCYTTSQRLVTVVRDKRLSYIEGFTMFQEILPIAHGWNAFHHEGITYYFDLTQEIALEAVLEGLTMIKVLELNFKQVSKVLLDTEYYGNMIPLYYKKFVAPRGR